MSESDTTVAVLKLEVAGCVISCTSLSVYASGTIDQSVTVAIATAAPNKCLIEIDLPRTGLHIFPALS